MKLFFVAVAFLAAITLTCGLNDVGSGSSVVVSKKSSASSSEFSMVTPTSSSITPAVALTDAVSEASMVASSTAADVYISQAKFEAMNKILHSSLETMDVTSSSAAAASLPSDGSGDAPKECPFALDGAFPLKDNNLIGLSLIQTRNYVISFFLYPSGIVTASETNVLDFRYAGMGVPRINFIANSTRLTMTIGVSQATSVEVSGLQDLPLGSWSKITASLDGTTASLSVESSVSSNLSYQNVVALPSARGVVTAVAIYGSAASSEVPASNAFVSDLKICRPAVPVKLTTPPSFRPTATPSARPSTAEPTMSAEPTSSPTAAYTIFVPSPTSFPTTTASATE
jgi:hypothetical protein